MFGIKLIFLSNFGIDIPDFVKTITTELIKY